MTNLELLDTARPDLNADEARALTDDIYAGISNVLPLIAEAFARRAWRALGYESWDAYCDAELSGLRVPIQDRREAVVILHDAGMSQRAIGAALGIDHKTAAADLKGRGEFSPRPTVTDSLGRQQPATKPERTTPPISLPPTTREGSAAGDDRPLSFGDAATGQAGGDEAPGPVPPDSGPRPAPDTPAPDVPEAAAHAPTGDGVVPPSPPRDPEGPVPHAGPSGEGEQTQDREPPPPSRRVLAEAAGRAWIREVNANTPDAVKARVNDLERRIGQVLAVTEPLDLMLAAATDPAELVATAPDAVRHRLRIVPEAHDYLTRLRKELEAAQ